MRRLHLSASILFAVALLAGCASRPEVSSTAPQPVSSTASQPVSTLETVDFPSLGRVDTTEIGQSMISRAYVRRYPALVLSRSVEDKPNSPGVTRLAAGKLPLYKATSDGKFYIDVKAVYVMLGAAVPTDDSGIFVPTDKAKPAVIYHYRSGGMFGAGKGYTFGTIPVSVPAETIEEQWTTGSFKRELVYGGVFQNVMTLVYKEFKEDIARPAFSQEIKYDLTEGKVVGYKGARFEVIKATNTELTYKVLKHLD